LALGAQLSQPEKAKDKNDDHHEADNVNDAIHEQFLFEIPAPGQRGKEVA
jgi:hypothetical protein